MSGWSGGRPGGRSGDPWSGGREPAYAGSAELRASDADREHVAAVLRRAAEEGRLDFAELEERLERLFRAKTYNDLEGLTTDLPPGDGVARPDRSDDPGLPTRVAPDGVTAAFGKQEMTGRWLVPAHLSVKSFFGEVRLDFTDAVMPSEVVIDASVALGSIRLKVPDDVAVVFETDTTFLVDSKNKTTAEPALGTPIVRVRGRALLGELSARGPRKRWFEKFRR